MRCEIEKYIIKAGNTKSINNTEKFYQRHVIDLKHKENFSNSKNCKYHYIRIDAVLGIRLEKGDAVGLSGIQII